jgi:DNA topoisomerase-1
MLQIGEATDEEKPSFASLPSNTTLETVTLEEALEMFKLPREVGKTENGEVILANVGRFGPYIKVDKTFVSIKDLDPLTITETEARKIYKEKKKEIDNKYIKQFNSGIKIVNGPYGPYVTNGKRNVKIADEQDAKNITEKEAKELLSQAPRRKAPPRRRKTKK